MQKSNSEKTNLERYFLPLYFCAVICGYYIRADEKNIYLFEWCKVSKYEQKRKTENTKKPLPLYDCMVFVTLTNWIL